MLKLIENLSDKTPNQLAEFFKTRLSEMYVLFSLLDWANVDGAWLQTEGDGVTALVVQKEMSKAYVCANENADFYELAVFLRGLGGMVIHCSSDITEKIGVTPFSKITLMSLENDIKEGKTSVTVNDNLRPVFDLLTQEKRKLISSGGGVHNRDIKKYSDRAYNEWLSKTSRGIFNSFTSVRAVKVGENSILSVAVADKFMNTVYIRDVATDSDFRKMGYASDCIRGLCKDFKKEGDRVFLSCNDLKTENFYKNLGFERKEYIELGIIEL